MGVKKKPIKENKTKKQTKNKQQQNQKSEKNKKKDKKKKKKKKRTKKEQNKNKKDQGSRQFLSLLNKECCCWEVLSTYAHVLCEVVLVFACMFYHADYYIILVIAYDYKCPHASFYGYVRMGSEPGTPPPHPRTHTHKRTNEEDLWITTREKMNKGRK